MIVGDVNGTRCVVEGGDARMVRLVLLTRVKRFLRGGRGGSGQDSSC
jgi:hypothetical protein